MLWNHICHLLARRQFREIKPIWNNFHREFEVVNEDFYELMTFFFKLPFAKSLILLWLLKLLCGVVERGLTLETLGITALRDERNIEYHPAQLWDRQDTFVIEIFVEII